MKYIVLWLEGPLQAWGYESKFDLRTTFPFPTISGLFGMLLAASGDSGPQTELLDRMKNVQLTAIEYIDRTFIEPTVQLCDYHMVGSGYNNKSQWESLNIPRTNEGKIAVLGGAKQTFRYYLQDRKFGAILAFQDDLAEKFADAMTAPVYDLYLGRKCCVPTDFIYRGLYDTESDAKDVLTQIAEEKELKQTRTFVQSDETDPDAFVLADIPLEFGPRKRYASRYVTIL